MSTSTTCTVVVAGDGSRCGQPAVTTFRSLRGGVFAECADHAVNVSGADLLVRRTAAHPPTRTSKPFVLVADGAIVGYADSDGPAVQKRAAKLGAQIVPVQR
jgi:hypothetical protein